VTVDGISIAENCPAANLNNAARSTLALIRNSFSSGLQNFLAGTSPLAVASGGTGLSAALTTNALVKQGASALAASIVSDDGTTATVTGALSVTGAASAASASIGGNVTLSGLAQNATGTRTIGAPTTSDPIDPTRAYISFNNVAGASSSSSYIVFGTNNYGVSGGERARLDQSGNFGIGCTPSYKLDVAGTGHFTGAVNIDGALTLGSTSVTLASGTTTFGTGTANFSVGLQVGGVAVVSLSASQTLTNKTLTSPSISSPTFAGSITPDSTFADSAGYLGLPQNAKTASYTLVLTDAAKDIYITGTTASQTITIPANASVAFPVGTVIKISNDSNQNWSLAITSDTLVQKVTGATGTRTIAPQGDAVLEKKTATRWWVSGAGLT